ncbi:S-adenosyl-L-methionine-dependent methyltransferase [Jimgerdemannia flammicorona]|uniref:S-adenosyl-L-methionine-dependent methyltransferase n=1 Tax=Jimgerdemannia flammicorona TaxID=994334 RepID=A0A433DDM8_9FUNG|nr:S-adenosyl-L-methionine-dependent methyltransferase [Jimgerdemannia flammicorona]
MATFSRANFNSPLFRDFRPNYTPALYDLIYRFHAGHGGKFLDVVDVGTGTGLVAEALSEKFDKMLSNAVQKPNIDYQEASAERLPFADSRVDVITSGQAFHWFDHPKFFGEAKRILKPRGTLAIFGYSVSIIKDNKEATDIFYEYATGLIGKVHWYFSHEGHDTTNLGSVSQNQFMEHQITLDWFETFAKTWSTYANYREKHPEAEGPAERMIRRLSKAIGVKDRDTETFAVQWPTVLVVAENDK